MPMPIRDLLTHRRCRGEQNVLHQELADAHTLLDRRDEELEATTLALRDIRHRYLEERLDRYEHQERANRLTTENEQLQRQIWDLECQINTLEQDADDRRALLEARRRRAAEHTLGAAWRAPSHDSSHGRALVAQALMALPLESYDVEITFDPRRNRWRIDGTAVGLYGTPEHAREQIIARYGVTETDLDEIETAASQELLASSAGTTR